MPLWTSWKNGDAGNPTSTITKQLKSKDIPATTVITMAKSSNVMQNTGDAEIHHKMANLYTDQRMREPHLTLSLPSIITHKIMIKLHTGKYSFDLTIL